LGYSCSQAYNNRGLLQSSKDAIGQTGLLYMRARYYNPYISRFINADPSGFNGGLNYYAFCDDNPVSQTDPFGLDVTSRNSPPDLQAARNPIVYPPDQAFQTPGSAPYVGAQPYYDPSLPSTYTVLNLDDSMSAQQAFQVGFLGALAVGQAVIGDYAGDFLLADEIAAEETTALSTYRMTTEGETFYHYGYAEDASSFEEGLLPGGHATSVGDLSGVEAQSGLALPRATPPNAVYTVTPKPGTWVRANPITTPQFGQPGGLPEFQFPGGTGPGTVSSPMPILPR
jgi:RHS repeat-associated protein